MPVITCTSYLPSSGSISHRLADDPVRAPATGDPPAHVEASAPGEPSDIELLVPAGAARRRAAIAGDFSAWVPIAMLRTEGGDWRLRVVVPPTSSFTYRLILDDVPGAPRSVSLVPEPAV